MLDLSPNPQIAEIQRLLLKFTLHLEALRREMARPLEHQPPGRWSW